VPGRDRALSSLTHRTPEETVGHARTWHAGDELAVCRALSGLSHDLFEASVLDVEAKSGASSTFTM
jgi:hypothetical protein